MKNTKNERLILKVNAGATNTPPQESNTVKKIGRPYKNTTARPRTPVTECKKSKEIEKLLQLKKFLPEELAQSVGVRPRKITEYLNGKHEIKVNTLKNWCDILNINIKKLFD